MDNISAEYDWVTRVARRFNEIGILVPPIQRHLYESIEKEWVSGKTVIDMGCGLGIGSNILSHHARAVWGIDVNEWNINFATQAFKRPNLDFEVYDIENPPTRGVAPFEVVVMCEVIEHLVDVEKGLRVFKSFFSDKLNTVGFITCPNIGNEEIKERDAANELHLHHWNAGEFYELLIQHFGQVTLYDAEKLDRWTIDETVGGDSKAPLIVAKVETPL